MMTYIEAAFLVLGEAGEAMTEEQIIERAVSHRLIEPRGKNPVHSLATVLRRASQNPSALVEPAGPRSWRLKRAKVLDHPMSMRQAALAILEKAGRPLHYREITRRAIRAGLLSSGGRTPAYTLRARIGDDIHRNPDSPFVRVGDGTYALKAWQRKRA